MKLLRNMTEPELREFTTNLARKIEEMLPPGPSLNDKCMFFLMFTDDLGPGISQYVANFHRDGAVKMLRETANRLEQRQDVTR